MEKVKATTNAVGCTLPASDLRKREEEFRTRLLDLVTTAGETDDGYVFELEPGSIDAVRELVALETECCSFMTYTIEDRGGRICLSLSGPAGTKEFVRDVWLAGAATHRHLRKTI